MLAGLLKPGVIASVNFIPASEGLAAEPLGQPFFLSGFLSEIRKSLVIDQSLGRKITGL